MNCPQCNRMKLIVTRTIRRGPEVYRKRACIQCGYRTVSLERECTPEELAVFDAKPMPKKAGGTLAWAMGEYPRSTPPAIENFAN